MKQLLRNINLLNILLIGIILILVNYTVLPLFNMNVRITLPSVKTPHVNKDEQPTGIDIPLLTDYTMIAENNLFHPERKVNVDKADNQPLEQPDFILYGTLITDDVCIAYLEDRKSPTSTTGRGKRHTILRLGDTLSGYILREIAPDTVVMERGDDRVNVNITDSTKQRIQVGKATGSGSVTSRPPLTQHPTTKNQPGRVSGGKNARGQEKQLREESRKFRANDRKYQQTERKMIKRESRSLNPHTPAQPSDGGLF